jgi:uncharacterized protein (TIGR03118 family)
VGGNIAVTYAQQDSEEHDDVPGVGKGYVDIFTPAGVLVTQLHHGPWMNAPWAVTIAAADFGRFGNKYLVGNFGSGKIAAFRQDGQFNGLLRGPKGRAIKIDGLWGLAFGNGATAGPVNVLFFAAGPSDESHGLFGTLTATTVNDDPNNLGDDEGNDDDGN